MTTSKKNEGPAAMETKARAEGEKKSTTMTGDELGEKIKSAVKEALAENEEAKGEEDTSAADGVEAGDIGTLIEDAMNLVSEKRKARKEDGETLGDVTPEEIIEAIQELAGGEDGEGKADEEETEEKEDADKPEEKRKSRTSSRHVKSRAASAPVQRKYASIFLTGSGEAAKKAREIPPAVQLARAIKCLDIRGRNDPEQAAYFAKKMYGDDEMAREFKALNATSPTSGGFLIPEVYLDQMIELLYSKTVITELGAQKVPMSNGNLNIPKMTGGARATWGGESRRIAKSEPTFGNIKLSAKRLEAIIPQTRELLMSTSFSADQMFANDLTRRMELGLDYGALFGVGGEFQPTGVTTNPDVEKLDARKLDNADIADAAGKITADFPVFIRSKVLAKNVDDLHLGWTFNSVMEGCFMNMKTTTGAYIYRDEMTGGKLLGFPYRVTNQIPTERNGLTTLIFGNWNDLLIGEQLGLETYTTMDGSWVDELGVQHNAFDENLAATRALMYVDIAVRHAESFLVVNGIKVN